MQKALYMLLLFFALTILVALCIFLPSSGTSPIQSGAILPDNLSKHSYYITPFPSCSTTVLDFTLRSPLKTPPDNLHLIITDIRSFCLTVNAQQRYTYQGTPASHRVHDIPLLATDWMEGTLHIQVSGELLTPTCKFLLGTEQNVLKAMYVALMLNTLIIGIDVAVIINCLLLFFRKRSETYLMYMAAFSLCLSLTGIIYSNYPVFHLALWDILHMGYLNAVSQIIGLILCIRITHFSLPDKLNQHLFPLLLSSVLLIIFLLNRFTNLFIRSMFTNLLSLLMVYVLIRGYCGGEHYALHILCGLSLCEGVKLYYQMVNQRLFTPLAMTSYIHLPEYAYLAFLFSCLFVVDSIFSQKFQEADQLSIEVSLTNRLLNEKVRERTKELEDANQELLRAQAHEHALMLNIFHDLRSPLFSASGYAEMILGAQKADEENLEVLRHQLAYLTRLTENLLFIAKLAENMITFLKVPVELQDICLEVLADARPACLQKADVLESDTESVCVLGDSLRLRQAVENLVSNAVQHTDAQTTIKLSLHPINGSARLTVSDTGCGIDASKLPHIFERSYTCYQHTKRDCSGLGLAIVKEIIKAHDGTIQVESILGHGTVFTILLPLYNPDDDK